MKTIWFDFTNPPHVNFFTPFIHYFKGSGNQVICTARDFAETVDLLTIHKIKFKKFGKYQGKNRFRKLFGLLSREFQLLRQMKGYDISFSSNYESPLVSWLKGKSSFVFDDNDISPNWLYSHFADYIICPESIDKDAMYGMGIKQSQLLTYNGFKENIYIADYKPDKAFLEKIPFSEFITVRPENIFASYIPTGTKSIVPELINRLIADGHNILYLPRYPIDKTYVKSNAQIFSPPSPLSGLDVCYYSNAVLTGAGTFSREAAIMGTPAVSFYAGKKLLGVDKKMKDEKMVFFSRDPHDIVQYVHTAKKKSCDFKKSKEIQSELFKQLEQKIDTL